MVAAPRTVAVGIAKTRCLYKDHRKEVALTFRDNGGARGRLESRRHCYQIGLVTDRWMLSAKPTMQGMIHTGASMP